MSDDGLPPSKGERTVANLKVTGRNEEGKEPVTIGEAIRAVFADCSEAGSTGGLDITGPVVETYLTDKWNVMDFILLVYESD